MTKQKLFLANERDIQNLTNIKENMNIMTDAGAIRYALQFAVQKLNPAYVQALRERPTRTKLSAEDTERAKIERKAVHAKMLNERDEKIGGMICEALDGEKINDGGGLYSCRYYDYEKAGGAIRRYEMKLPFNMLTVHTIKRQFTDCTASDAKVEFKDIKTDGTSMIPEIEYSMTNLGETLALDDE